MDPFHDTDTHVAGFPDAYHDSTVVFYDKQVETIRKPKNLPAGQTWSCMVVTVPVLKHIDCSPFFNSTLSLLEIPDTNHVSTTALGTVTALSAADDVPLFPTTQPSGNEWLIDDPNNTRESKAFGALEQDFTSMGRLVAGGFEVHNDTPDLYKGGSVTVFSAPQEASETFSANAEQIGDNVRICNFKNHKGLPATRNDASLYRSARTWEASEGCLVPFQLNLAGDGITYRAKGAVANMFRSGETETAAGFVQSMHPPGISTPLVGPTHPCRGAPLDTSGSFFSGLNENTVLTLTVKSFVEVAPSTIEKQLLKLSSPSAMHDEHAIACYNHCIAALPPGVPVGFNDAGEWWRMVLARLREKAPTVVPRVVNFATGMLAPDALPVANAIASRTQGKLVTKMLDRAIQNSQDRSDRRQKAKSENKHRRR
jgi:hypothetical protein